MDSGFVKISTALIIFSLVFLWVFIGRPQIWQNPSIPPKIQKALADLETLRPNATGTYQEWDLVDTSHNAATSDQNDATYIETGVDEERDIQNLDNTTFDAGDTIDQIEVFITCKAPGGGGAKEKVATLIREGGTDTESGAANGDRNNFVDISTVYTTNPRTSSAWQKSEIDALEAGARLKTIGNGETVQCSEIRVVVTFTVAISVYEQSAYRWFENLNSTSTGPALAAQDASTTLAVTGDEFRLRALLHVTTAVSSPGVDNFKLQFATSTAGSCNYDLSNYIDIATASGDIRYFNNTAPADGDLLNASSSDPTHGSDATSTQTYEEANNFTVTSTINIGEDGLWDFALDDFSAPSDTTYCFRVVKSDDSLIATSTNTKIPEITTAADGVNNAPTVSNVNISPDPITLTENTTTSITITATITDTNGCDEVFVNGTTTAVLYRSGVGASCTADDNNCYRNIILTEVGDTCTGGADTDGDAVATTSVWFFAEATDASSTFPGETWQTEVTAEDSSNATGTATDGTPPELNTLWAINVTGSISYGSVNPNTDTGSTNQTTTVTNTGNAALDVDLSGTDMILGANTIAVGNQKYATSTFTYSTCTICTTLTTTPTVYELDLAKPTSATPVTDDVFWGLAVPDGSAVGTYSGTDTFEATGD